MRIRLSDFNSRLQSASTLDQQMDCALLLAPDMGFDAGIYDYSPVPVSHDGALITPSLLSLRNTPEDGHSLLSFTRQLTGLSAKTYYFL